MKTIYLILFSILLTSCPKNIEEGDFVTLSKGRMYGGGSEGFQQENIIISSEKEWTNFLTKAKVDDKIKIDFSKNTILVIIDKVRNSGGFSVEVEKIIPKEKELEVFIKTQGPKPTDMVTMAIEQPYCVVKINKTSKKIIFK